MKKWMKILMSISMSFSLWACSTKTDVNLNEVTFQSFYLGSNLNPPENERIQLTESEAHLVESFIDKEGWAPVDPKKDTLEPIGVLLYDTNGLRYELYQALEFIVIKVTSEKEGPVYFQVEGDNALLIYGQLRPLKRAIENKTLLLKSKLISANSDVSAASEDTIFDLTLTQSNLLQNLLKIGEWNAIQDDLFDSSVEADLSIKVANGNTLMFKASTSQATVTYLQTIDGKMELSTYQITTAVYDAVKAQLKSWQIEAYPVKKLGLDTVVFTQVKFQLDGVPTHLLKSVFFPITEAESNQAKAALDISNWVRVSFTPTDQLIFMTLKDARGFVYTIYYSESGLAVYITQSSDPTFQVSFVIPVTTINLASAFMPLWEAALATKAMLAFVPIQLKIGTIVGEEATYRSVNLSSVEARALISLLELSTWAVDPDPFKYAFGWLPKYILKDDKGNSFSIYDYFTHDLMVVVVRTSSTPSDEWLYYFTSNTFYKDLETYVFAHYPNP